MADYLAITIWQPFAMLIAEGAKHFEFRNWAPPRAMWNTRIAIHAGARPTRKSEVRELLLKLHGSSWRETGLQRESAIALLDPVLMAPGRLPLSSIVCTTRLGEPIRDDALAAALGLPRLNDSDRDEHSNYGWPLTDIERLQPFVPARGGQGFWTWRSP